MSTLRVGDVVHLIKGPALQGETCHLMYTWCDGALPRTAVEVRYVRASHLGSNDADANCMLCIAQRMRE